MKILYDHLCFWEKYGGVSKYFTEILKNFPEESYDLSLKFTNNEYVSELSHIKVKQLFNKSQFRGKARLISEIGKLFTIPKLLEGNYDIYHPTHYDCYGLKFVSQRAKTVATIHDMNYFAIPQFYNSGGNIKRNQIKMINQVDHIITISNTSKDDILKYTSIDSENISVIYHGVNHGYINSVRRIDYNFPYFLFVGRRSEYKNFKIVVEAFSKLKRQNNSRDLYLVCAGSPFTSTEEELFWHMNVSDSVKIVQATDEQLVNLYRNAIAFIFPSFYEGFGLPILEAMTSECPTIISNCSCFPEVAQDCSLYFEPTEKDQLIAQMEKLLDNEDLRKKLIRDGKSRAMDFDWKKCSEKHLKVYKSLL